MYSVKLKKEIKIGEKNLKEITFDFDKLTGSDLLYAERIARLKNPAVIDVTNSLDFIYIIASKAAGLGDAFMLDMPAVEAVKIISVVSKFLNGLPVPENISEK